MPFTKGHLLGFKKGYTPWNKGKKWSNPANIGPKPWVRESNLKLGIGYKKGHPNYFLGYGKTSINKRERARFRNSIQKLVFERDNYTCQLCGIKGVILQVDHIQSWADYIELRFEINNCRTLCVKCHYKITYGKPLPKSIKSWGRNLSKGGALVF
jgi:hypothetical protein